MKSLIFLVCVFFITGCGYRHTKPLNERIEDCKVGYQMVLQSGLSDMTESVIFQIVLKKLNGSLGDTEELESELSQLILVSENESTRKKAELALYFLTNIDDFEIALIRSEYHDENKLYHMLEEYFSEKTPDYTQVK
jgi:hypothetical protein